MVICAPWFVRLITGNFARAIVLFPFIFIRYSADKNNPRLLNHERIHFRQQLELLVVPFYVWYLVEYAWHRQRKLNHFQAYRRISFEREAYVNENDFNYLKGRSVFGFWKYLI